MSFITLKCLQKKSEISISPAKNAWVTVSFWKSRFWGGINLWNTFTGLRSLPPSPPQPPPHHIPPGIHPHTNFSSNFFLHMDAKLYGFSSSLFLLTYHAHHGLPLEEADQKHGLHRPPTPGINCYWITNDSEARHLSNVTALNSPRVSLVPHRDWIIFSSYVITQLFFRFQIRAEMYLFFINNCGVVCTNKVSPQGSPAGDG